MSVHREVKRVTTHVLQEMKHRGEKISMLTAYDYSMASIVDQSGMDIILVGDSLGMVLYGMKSTKEVKIETVSLCPGIAMMYRL